MQDSSHTRIVKSPFHLLVDSLALPSVVCSPRCYYTRAPRVLTSFLEPTIRVFRWNVSIFVLRPHLFPCTARFVANHHPRCFVMRFLSSRVYYQLKASPHVRVRSVMLTRPLFCLALCISVFSFSFFFSLPHYLLLYFKIAYVKRVFCFCFCGSRRCCVLQSIASQRALPCTL